MPHQASLIERCQQHKTNERNHPRPIHQESNFMLLRVSKAEMVDAADPSENDAIRVCLRRCSSTVREGIHE